VKSSRRINSAIRDWNDIQFALVVAAAGSFHVAASRLGVHETTISRRVQALERELGAKLFVRHAYGMAVTRAGESLVEKARAMEDAANLLRSDIGSFDAKLSGVVRLSVPEGIGAYWLTPALFEFHKRCPDIALEVTTTAQRIDLLASKMDVSITIERPKEPRLIVQRVGVVRYHLVASSKYVQQHGEPLTLKALHDHKLLTVALYKTTAHLKWWNERVEVSGQPTFLTNSPNLYLAAIREGFGIGMLPTFYWLFAPDLIALSLQPDCQADVWLGFHEASKQNARVRAVTDFLKSRFSQDRFRWFV
jgi:DNA-binding transcriptional LysR family regulator